MTVSWSDEDRAQIRNHGLEIEEVERQLRFFALPPRPARLDRPCAVGDGIVRLQEDDLERYESLYDDAQAEGRFSKLVPASGAASRMFQSLLAVYNGERSGAPAADADREAAQGFLAQLPRFPFYGRLHDCLRQRGQDLSTLRQNGEVGPVLAALLEADGLDLARAPKALVPFHHPPTSPAQPSSSESGVAAGATTAGEEVGEHSPAGLTPLEEHLIEAAEHLRDRDGRCRIHFTIPQHQEMAFRECLREIAGRLEPRYQTSFEVSLSIQNPSTDTVAGAVGDDGSGTGEPFRDGEGRLVLRPGGHGALLDNLSRLDGDLVLLRNIDNIQPAHRRGEVLRWNRILGGYLLEIEAAMVQILSRLERARAEDPQIDDEIRQVAEILGQPELLSVLDSPARAKQAFLADLLDRPIRVAGVVANSGEPGGGPFWVTTPAMDAGAMDLDGARAGGGNRAADQDGASQEHTAGHAADENSRAPSDLTAASAAAGQRITPQIIEMSQVDRADPDQALQLSKASHFNPVHLVCRLRSHRGDAYDLQRFVDPAAVFISTKSHQGRQLLALERPGLWNGAMAHWTTVFVEIPAAVFAPVKTVFDLLRPEHQPAAEPADLPGDGK